MFATLVESLIVTDDAALVERLRANELEVRRLAAEQAAITREVERRRLYQDDGHRSVKSFLRAQLGWSGNQAATHLKVAQLLDTVPGAGDRLSNGHIGVAQAVELGRLRANPRAGDRLAEFAPTLLDAAEQLKYEDFRIVGRRWESIADTEGADQRAASNVEHRDATVFDVGGELFMRASGGSAIDAAEMAAVFESFTEHEFRVDCGARDAEHGPNAPTSLLPRTDKQRRRDALQAIFRAAQSAADAGLTVGPIPTVVNIIATQFDAEQSLAAARIIPTPTDLAPPTLTERRKETSSGSPIGDDDLLRAMIHGRVRSIVMDHTGMPISYGRTRRLFTGPIREMAKLLGHRCSHPGCDVPAERCQIDHLTEFARGNGETSLSNAGAECSSHNRFKHRARLTRSRLGTDHVVATRADGTEMRPVGQRTRVDMHRAHRPKRRRGPGVDEAVRRALRDRGESGELAVVRLRIECGEYRLAG